MLSVVVITRNEADRIERCLASVAFAAERLVVDCGSTDDTVAVARAAGARVISTDWPGHVAQKNRALAAASQPWVLSLDADEALSAEAGAALVVALAAADDVAGFSFNRRNIWLGRRLSHGRWYPDRKVRVVRAGLGRWVGDDPHDRLEAVGPVRWLPGDIVHVPYRNFGEHWSTIRRYTKIQASQLHARGVRARWWELGLRPPLHFVDAYLLRMGFRDGAAGLAVAGLGAAYVALKWGRVWALSRR